MSSTVVERALKTLRKSATVSSRWDLAYTDVTRLNTSHAQNLSFPGVSCT